MSAAAQTGEARRFAGRVALVTGASRGFGAAVAEALAAEGAQVVAVARTVGGLEELDDRIKGAGGAGAVLVPLDLTEGEGVDRLGAALYERFGKLDLAVHAAAMGARLTPVAHLDPKDLARLTAINLTATHRLIRSVDPLLRLSDGAVFALIDDPKGGEALWSGYGATKAAAAALARSYAAETPTVRVLIHTPPAMPTQLRARTHPGEDKTALSSRAAAAAGLLDALSDRDILP